MWPNVDAINDDAFGDDDDDDNLWQPETWICVRLMSYGLWIFILL